jgi:hypothetical protein
MFFLFIPFYLFGQVLNYLSSGYNTKEIINDGNVYINRYLINKFLYSNVWIYYLGDREPVAL